MFHIFMWYTQNAIVLLQEKWFKITTSRLAILDILWSSTKVLSFNDIVQNNPDKNLDNITVYRFLQILDKLHLAKKIHALNGYVFCDGHYHLHNHYFLVCGQCHSFEEKIIDGKESYVSRLGIFPDKHSIEIIGLCQQCGSLE